MNSRNIILLVLTAIVVIGAWQISKTNAPTVDLAADTLYPELIENVNDIQSMVIRSSDAATELKRIGDSWVIGNRDDFPAKFDTVKSTILKIAETSVIEKKTAMAEKYATLGVNDPTESDAKGIRVDIKSSSDAQLASLIIGDKRQGRALGEENYYIRRTEDAASYLVSGDLDISAQIDDWLDADIVDIDTARIRRIVITPAGEAPITIEKEKASDNFFSVQNIPEGFKAKSRAAVSSLGAVLLSVRFEDVISVDRVAESTPRGLIEATTFDGLVATLARYDFQDNEYVKMSFSFDEITAMTDMSKLSGSDDAAKNEADDKKSVAEEATELNARTSKWLYALPDFKMRMLDKRLSDLIEPVKDEEKPAAATAGSEP